MKKLFIIVVYMFMSFTVHAQITAPFPQNLQKKSAIDTARYKVTYNLKYKNHPADKNYLSDVRNVYIGKRYVRDFSDIIFHFDSLCTEASRHGAVTRSNIQGNPWPIELIVEGGKKADIKYRMPLQTGVLNFQQDLPQFNWKFIEGQTRLSATHALRRQSRLQAEIILHGTLKKSRCHLDHINSVVSLD